MWVVLCVLWLLAVLLLCPIRVKLVFASQWGEANARIIVRVLSLPIVFRFRIHLSIKSGLSIYLLQKDGNAKKLLPQRKKVKNKKYSLSVVAKKTKIKKFDLYCAVGVEKDPAATAILCGCLQILLQNACAVLSARGKLDAASIQVLPVWERDIVRIKLESILEILPTQIIYIILGKGLKRKNESNGGKKDGTSN